MRALVFLLLLTSPAHAEQSACLAEAASRYVGESERNLSRRFALATQSDVVLAFDEADALFGRGAESENQTRDGHDRYANQEVATLLARIESFGGGRILVSNFGDRTLIAGFDRRSRNAGIIVIKTEIGVRAIEFTRADVADAFRYARETLHVCPVARR
jgi:SpoVK/Ycf46/Vps4 family AAA+-type ATPase